MPFVSPSRSRSPATGSRRPLAAAVSAAVCLALAGGAQASDARAIALGGSIIADGRGVPGALANPAALMEMKRRGQRVHVGIGLQADIRDEGGLIELGGDNDSLADDTDEAIGAIDLQEVSCIVQDADRDTPCLDGLNELGGLTARALDLLDDIDGEPIAGQGGLDTGVAFTGRNTPFAVHLQTRLTARGRARVSEGDRAYLADFADALEDGVLTLGEIEDSAQFAIDQGNQTLQVTQPGEELDSEVAFGGVGRVTLGVSVATSLTVAGVGVDLGVTPKLSALVTQGIVSDIGDEFDDDAPGLVDQLEASESEDTSFTVDIGAATVLSVLPIRLAAVLRNAIGESIETAEGVEFETTPQLIVGGIFDLPGPLNLNADLALNEADVDSVPTQPLALGAEFAIGPIVALRGGINHDAARRDDATALSLGLGLGPFAIGARAASLDNTEIGAQLSFSF